MGLVEGPRALQRPVVSWSMFVRIKPSHLFSFLVSSVSVCRSVGHRQDGQLACNSFGEGACGGWECQGGQLTLRER